MSISLDDFMKGLASITLCVKPVYSLPECIFAADDSDTAGGDYSNCAAGTGNSFRECLRFSDRDQLDFLRYAAELTEKRMALENPVDSEILRGLSIDEYVYLFLWEDSYSLVLPDELIAIFREVTMAEGFTEQNSRYREFYDWFSALSRMYGICKIRQFVNVWNHCHEEQTTYDEAAMCLAYRPYCGDCFSVRPFILAVSPAQFFDFDSAFADDDYIVHSDCYENGVFYRLLMSAGSTPYYMPTTQVIAEFMERAGDELNIPGKREMDSFLEQHVKGNRQLTELQENVARSFRRLTSPADIREMLSNAGAPVRDDAFRAEFERIYNRVREEARIWDLKGFTPRQYQATTGNEIESFKLPEG